jgi:CHASE3 domain sensor protein
MDVIDAAVQRDIVLLLAVIVVILGGVVALLFWLIVKEFRARITRAEGLTDRAIDAFDGLETATTTAVAVARDNAEVAKHSAELAQKSLDELRRR